jgi:hypothetical protein
MASEYMFLTDDYGHEEGILVAKRDWFKQMPISELFNEYGQSVEVERGCDYCDTCSENEENDKYSCDCEECIENLPVVLAYNYWNGQNHASVVIEGEGETRYSEVTDEEEIARYEQALENMKHECERGGIDYFKAPGFDIQRSRFQGAWELYTITKRDEDNEE